MTKQVEKRHYNFRKYAHKGRWVSYFHQLDEVLALRPKSILEVGVGDSVFGSYIKKNTKVDYKSVDIAEDLKPDVVGSVLSLPFPDNFFDVVCVFEVLEHLPYEKFDQALSEISRVANKNAVISIPHFGPRFQFFIKIPLMPELSFSWKLPFFRKHEFNGEHYWEIGKRGYAVFRIVRDIQRHFKIIREFVPFENQYHHFFILEKK